MPRLGRTYLIILVASLLAVVVVPSIASAAGNTYVVATNGDDNARGDVNAPLRTIEAGVSRLKPGDTLLVRGGDYSSPYGPEAPVDINGLRATAAQQVRIAAYPGERPVRHGSGWQVFRIFNSTYVTLEGFEIVGTALSDRAPTAGVEVNESNHIAVLGNVIHDTGGSGVSAIHSDDVRVQGNQIWGTTKWSEFQTSAINFFESVDSNTGPGLFGYNNHIVGNLVYNNQTLVPGPEGIITDGNCIIIDSNRSRGYTGATAILNNICVGNGGRGINVNRSDHVLVINNTVSGNVNHVDQPAAELNATYASDVVFRNNLVSPNRADRALIVFDAQGVSTDDNVYVASNPPQMGAGDQLVPALPLFLGSIPATGSPVTDVGNTDRAPTIDLFGNPRHGRPDAGAVER
jgi:parallel beta-helix repeat protein